MSCFIAAAAAATLGIANSGNPMPKRCVNYSTGGYNFTPSPKSFKVNSDAKNIKWLLVKTNSMKEADRFSDKSCKQAFTEVLTEFCKIVLIDDRV